MIMVRRRARPAKELPGQEEQTEATLSLNAAKAVAGSHVLEDQYFASPKRKDCRIEKTTTSAAERSNGRTIGVPLATRSQTRTIENFFKANAAAKKANSVNTNSPTEPIEEQKTIASTATELALADEDDLVVELLYEGHCFPTSSNSSPNYQDDEEEEEEEDVVAVDEIKHIDFQTHRSSALRDSHSSTHSSSSSATTDNIFLQEPVLTLDIDRTPTKASSIKINKSFELATAVFSSPPSVLNACVLNGRFNQIVSLEPHAAPLNGFDLADQHDDSSSCDSGVACCLNTLSGESPAAGRRRKPATPHRIVCPSPIKTLPREPGIMGGGARKASASGDPLSPRKSPRKLPATSAAVAACKSRRRLNQPKPQAPYQPPNTQPNQQLVVVLDDDDDDDELDLEDDMQAFIKSAEELENLNKLPTAKTAMLKPAPPKPKALKGSKSKTTAKSQALPLAATNGNREMTDFFPVRRSVRKTKTAVKEEWMRNLEQAVLEERCEGLVVRHFMGKGRGVVADRHFKRNEFVVEYVGDLISVGEAGERERRYALDENAGCYMYYFKHKTQQYCIDATVDTGKLGRLINHSRTGNLMTKVVVIKQRPHLVLLAKDDIEPGEELTYDYGDRSKESLLHHPWLAF